ncbi:MAG: nicotinate-nucleotide--dimethylbenzimidazole phosphoribosyltransferase [Spirochaetaceae bacterium]|nr:nicotinate-nucleotide--dimethylbenzimidazole phosphoribosyltransferase [Spirochaetaceae bacterium]
MFNERDIIKRQAQLILDNGAKIPSSLGILEDTIIKITQIQKTLNPTTEKATLLLVGADTGIVEEDISKSSDIVTKEQMENFARGNGVCALLSSHNNIELDLCNVGIKYDLNSSYNIKDYCLSKGTRNPVNENALKRDIARLTLDNGKCELSTLYNNGTRILLLGEMGIGNTTIAALLIYAILQWPIDNLIDESFSIDIYDNKYKAILSAFNRHGALKAPTNDYIFDLLTSYGGLDIIFLAGAILEANRKGVVILIDGLITTVAVLIASLFDNTVLDSCIACTNSKLTLHKKLLDYLGLTPLLDLSLSLGEGSGALYAYPLINNSIFIFNNLLSLEKAEVTDVNKHNKILFPLGTTSNILRANIIENVLAIAPLVDDIEITLFKSKAEYCYPSKEIIRELINIAARENITYTIHLPYDVDLGALKKETREEALINYLRMIEITNPLPIHGYVIHLVYNEEYKKQSLEYIKQGMKELINLSKVESTAFCVETLFQPFEPLLEIVKDLNLSLTIDIGHLVKNNFYSDSLLRSYLPYARIIHFHGVKEDKDLMKLIAHKSICEYSPKFLNNLYSILNSYSHLPIVFTIEVFILKYFKESLNEIQVKSIRESL